MKGQPSRMFLGMMNQRRDGVKGVKGEKGGKGGKV